MTTKPSAIAQIEAALAAGPTEGPWKAEEIVDADGTTFPSFTAVPASRMYCDPQVDADYIVACNPANVREVLSHIAAQDAEIARLTKCLNVANSNAESFERKWYLQSDEIARLKRECHDWWSAANSASQELQTLKSVIDSAWTNYERMGEVCSFEGNPMIYASVLEGIHDSATTAHLVKPAYKECSFPNCGCDADHGQCKADDYNDGIAQLDSFMGEAGKVKLPEPDTSWKASWAGDTVKFHSTDQIYEFANTRVRAALTTKGTI